MKKINSIIYTRVLATLLIIICHLAVTSSNNYIIMSAQFLNVGVFIFFLISGMLYSKKQINNKILFIKNKFRDLLIPMYIFLIFIFIFYYLKGTNYFEKIIYYLFNIQYFIKKINGTQHLWFMTIIFLCYFYLIIREYIKDYILIISLIIISLPLSYISKDLGMIPYYIITFIVGLKKDKIPSFKNKPIIKYSLLILFISTIRVIFKFLLDNTIFYDVILSSTIHIIISISIFNIIKILSYKINSNYFINFVDKYSYYIYIVHYIFIVGPLDILNLTRYNVVNICFVFILSFLFGYILFQLSNLVLKCFKMEA